MTLMKKIKSVFVLSIGVFVQACGGGGGGGDTVFSDGISGGGACDNAFHREIIGHYKGTASFPTDPQAIALGGSCTWDMDMTISINNDVGLCFLDMAVEAPVTQNVVLESSNPLVEQCFDESSIHDVSDNKPSGATTEILNAITFPHIIGFIEFSGFPARGPYFGDASVDAKYIYLLDGPNAPLDSMRVNGDGTIDVLGVAISGRLTKAAL